MSRRGNCYDNAVAESFFNLLKRERVRRRTYRTREEARRDVFDYIEVFYNLIHQMPGLNTYSTLNSCGQSHGSSDRKVNEIFATLMCSWTSSVSHEGLSKLNTATQERCLAILLSDPLETPFDEAAARSTLERVCHNVPSVPEIQGTWKGHEETIKLKYWTIFDLFEIALRQELFKGCSERNVIDMIETCLDAACFLCEDFGKIGRYENRMKEDFINNIEMNFRHDEGNENSLIYTDSASQREEIREWAVAAWYLWKGIVHGALQEFSTRRKGSNKPHRVVTTDSSLAAFTLVVNRTVRAVKNNHSTKKIFDESNIINEQEELVDSPNIYFQ